MTSPFLARRAVLRALLVLTALAVLPAAAQADPGNTIAFGPGPQDYGAVGIQTTSTQNLKLSNDSDTSAELGAPALSGQDVDEFSIESTSCGSTLPSYSSCDVAVRFQPLRSGAASAQLEVSNDGLASPATLPLVGTGAAPQLNVSGPISYGTVMVDRDYASQQVWVSNGGSTAAVMQSAQLDGVDAAAFTIEYDGCQGQTLNPGSGCNVSVRFIPQQGRDYQAVVHVRAAGAADYDVPLTGTGGVASVSSAPEAVDFGTLAIGSSASQPVVFTSDGNQPFQAIVAIVIGADVGAFKLERDLCSLATLDPGSTCDMAVRFTPSRAGHAEAKLLIITGNGQQRLVSLSGEGTVPASSGSSHKTTPPPASGTPADPSAETVRVVFERRHTGPAHYRDGRVRLGRARCDGAPACTVTVRSRFVIQTRRGPRLVRGDELSFSPNGEKVRLPIPTRRRGTPTQVLLKLTTSAEGHPTGTQVIALKLEPKT